MYNKRCCSCLFGGRCVSYGDCEYYAPFDDNMEDLELEQYKKEYYLEWMAYIAESE